MKRKIFLLAILTNTLAIAQTGNVGINTSTPKATLDIKSKGADNTVKALRIENSANTPTEMLTVLDNGNVGINESNPSTKLNIKTNTPYSGFKLVDTNQEEGKFLMSDANGNGSWEDYTTQYYSERCSTTTDIDLPYFVSVTMPGINGFTAKKDGKYMIYFHSFFKVTNTNQKSFYFRIFRNGVPSMNLETYGYIEDGSWFNVHVPYIATLAAGDVMTFQIMNSSNSTLGGGPGILTIVSSQNLSVRNQVEAVYLGK